jgi:hypothetical protein
MADWFATTQRRKTVQKREKYLRWEGTGLALAALQSAIPSVTQPLAKYAL